MDIVYTILHTTRFNPKGESTQLIFLEVTQLSSAIFSYLLQLSSSATSAIFSYLQLSSAIFSYLQLSSSATSAIFSYLQLSSAIFSYLQLSSSATSAIFSYLQLSSAIFYNNCKIRKLLSSNRQAITNNIKQYQTNKSISIYSRSTNLCKGGMEI